MTPNLSHVAGLELASEAVKDYTSPEAIQGAICRLLNQAKSAPPSPDAELVELLRECAGSFALWDSSPAIRLKERIDAKLASLKP